MIWTRNKNLKWLVGISATYKLAITCLGKAFQMDVCPVNKRRRRMHASKTKIMELDKLQENGNINNIHVERLQSFQCLGAMLTSNRDGASNIKQRLAMAVQALNTMHYLWNSVSTQN